MIGNRALQFSPYTAFPLGLEERVLADKKGVATEEGLLEIGKRVARFRKERGISQVEMAEKLGVSQPIISKLERGELRLHGELIIMLARILSVSSDEILGLKQAPTTHAAKDKRLLRRIKQMERLSRRDHEALLRTIDAFLAKSRTE